MRITEIVQILEAVTANPEEWIKPEPIKATVDQEASLKEAMDKVC